MTLMYWSAPFSLYSITRCRLAVPTRLYLVDGGVVGRPRWYGVARGDLDRRLHRERHLPGHPLPYLRRGDGARARAAEPPGSLKSLPSTTVIRATLLDSTRLVVLIN